jgi:PKD repeat protein
VIPVSLALLLTSLVSGTGTSQAQSPVVTFSTPGAKTVTLRVCNSAGCSTVTKTVTVIDPTPQVGAVSGPATVGTSQGPVTYSSSASGRPPLFYSWMLTEPDAETQAASTPSFTWTPVQVGSHQVSLQIANTWGAKSASLAVNVVPSVFTDVPPTYWAASFIEAFYFFGLTSGCSLDAATGARSFCPDNPVSRAELAVFVGSALHPPPFAPPAPTGVFTDVPQSYFAASWIEQEVRDGLFEACSVSPTRQFCPQRLGTRAEIAVLLVRASHGLAFTPPPATGIFADVPVTSPQAPWIEQLYRDGVTSGCQGPPVRLFCPNTTVTRAEMAVFFVLALHLAEKPTPIAFTARLCSSSSCSYPAGMPIDFNVQLRGGIPAAYDYDWNGDGTFEESAPFPISHTYASAGTYTPKLRLRLGSSSVVLSHPYPIRIFNPTGFLVAPSAFVVTNTGTVPPEATDPPGTPLRIAYNFAATAPLGTLGYAVFVNQGSGYLFAGLASGQPRHGDGPAASTACPARNRPLRVCAAVHRLVVWRKLAPLQAALRSEMTDERDVRGRVLDRS